MIPSSIKYDGNATPPQWTDNADQVIEKGTHIRVKIKGIRTELGNMYAIATIKEDYLGYVIPSDILHEHTDSKKLLLALSAAEEMQGLRSSREAFWLSLYPGGMVRSFAQHGREGAIPFAMGLPCWMKSGHLER